MPPSSYHHGDLRRAVLAAAVAVISEDGIAAVTLRELARRAGVSHAAPAHHFGDKRGLFTAIAVEGYHLLADALASVRPDRLSGLAEQGIAYVEFASAHPAHFEVMFRPDLLDPHDPPLVAARAHSRQALRDGVDDLPPERRPVDVEDAALAAWSLAHGFASLRLSGNLDRFLHGRDPAETFRAVASYLFAP